MGAALQVEYAKGALTSAIDLGTLGALYSIPGQPSRRSRRSRNLSRSVMGCGLYLGHDRAAQRSAYVRAFIQISRSSCAEGAAHVRARQCRYWCDRAWRHRSIHQYQRENRRNDARRARLWAFATMCRTAGRLLAEVDWTNWNRFHELRVVAANPAQPDDVTAANWGSGWFGSLGADYRVDERWHLRAGVGYDGSPIPSSTLGPRIPGRQSLMGVRRRALPDQ